MRKALLMFAGILLLSATTAPAVDAGGQEERERIHLKPALLVIDIQNAYMPMMAKEDVQSASARINEAIALFREFGHPVIRVYHTDPKRGPEPGTEAFEFPDSFAVTDEDVKVVKHHPSSFTKTNLEQILRDKDCNLVVLCGLSATGCVLATYYGARDREFYCVMIKDALLSDNAEYTDVIEDITRAMSLDSIRDTLEEPYL